MVKTFKCTFSTFKKYLQQTTVSDFEGAELYKSMTATPMVARCLQAMTTHKTHTQSHRVKTTPAPPLSPLINIQEAVVFHIQLPGSAFMGSKMYEVVTAGYGGSPTLNRVGIALGFSFFPPAEDLAISSNWLSSK